MQSDIELARNWRRAFSALSITIIAGTLTYAATGGPGLVFYLVGAVVLALVGIDLLIHARVERANRASAQATSALWASRVANQRSINPHSSGAGDVASVAGGST
jgi:hypothetical protein